jgi:hypothetical protein
MGLDLGACKLSRWTKVLAYISLANRLDSCPGHQKPQMVIARYPSGLLPGHHPHKSLIRGIPQDSWSRHYSESTSSTFQGSLSARIRADSFRGICYLPFEAFPGDLL